MTVLGVTVTYGDRFEAHCRPTIERALADGVDRMVVVDNGSADPSARALQQFADSHPQVELIRNSANEGSAAAFAAGLRFALQTTVDDVWMLDDDNAVEPGTLTALLAARAEETHGSEPVVVAARRIPNSLQERVSAGMRVEDVYPPRGAFLGFDAVMFLRARRRRVRVELGAARPRIPYAPYGGLLVPRQVLAAARLPMEELQLYTDDTIWTDAIVRSGTDIVLVADAAIEDSDGKWSSSTGGNSVSASVLSPHLDRLYLSTRNRVWFDTGRVQTSGEAVRYGINRLIVTTIAWLSAVRGRSFTGFRVMRGAARDGARGDFSKRIAL